MQGEKYYFRVEGSTRGEIEMNIGKLGTRKNSNFFFGWRGALVGVAGCGGHVRWVMQGEFCEVDHVRWVMRGGSREVGYTRWITRSGYARWCMQGLDHGVRV